MRLLLLILHCTWCIPQTLLGFCVFLRYIHHPHTRHRHALATTWPSPDGLSLGPFLFVPAYACPPHPKTHPLLCHEYGHTLQSLVLGPTYLLIIGLPSLVWANLPACQRLRATRGIPYSALYTERWADRWGQ